MELLLIIEKYEDSIYGDGLSKKEKTDICDYLDLGEQVKISDGDIGAGADFMVIVAAVLAVTNLFLVGDRIDKGIDGWIRIGRRIKKLIDKKEVISIDAEAASLVAIQFIMQFEKIESLTKYSEEQINFVRLDGMFNDGRKENQLISKPHNYYIQSFKINDSKIYIIGIKSSGETQLIKCFEFGNPYGLSEVDIQS